MSSLVEVFLVMFAAKDELHLCWTGLMVSDPLLVWLAGWQMEASAYYEECFSLQGSVKVRSPWAVAGLLAQEIRCSLPLPELSASGNSGKATP